MTASRNDFDPGILHKVVGTFGPTDRYDPIFRPVYKKRRDFDLRELGQVVCPQTAPLVFASLQLAKCSTGTRLPGEENDFVQHFLSQHLVTVDESSAQNSPRQRSITNQKCPSQFIQQWQTHR